MTGPSDRTLVLIIRSASEFRLWIHFSQLSFFQYIEFSVSCGIRNPRLPHHFLLSGGQQRDREGHLPGLWWPDTGWHQPGPAWAEQREVQERACLQCDRGCHTQGAGGRHWQHSLHHSLGLRHRCAYTGSYPGHIPIDF